MLDDLRTARVHLCKARTFIRRHLSKYLYPLVHEDLDYDIQSLQTIITRLEAGEPIPTQEAIPHGS